MKPKNVTAPIKATTQHFVEIEAIDNDVVLLQDKRCCCIIEVKGTNFQLLAEQEQEGIIYAYSQMLNSLSFPIQIVIISKKTNIHHYLDFLETTTQKQKNPLLLSQLNSYKEFITSIVRNNSVIQKSFYIIIPFSPLEMGIVANKKTNNAYVFTRAKISIYPKRDHIMKQLSKNGLGGVVLTEQSIVELFFNLYNPSSTGTVLAPVKEYTHLVNTN